MSTSLLGKHGESVAAKFLKKNKYKIIDINYKSRFGEIDLIASKNKVIAFIEVKLRKNDKFAKAREHVDYSKQKKIKTTAEIWFSKNQSNLQPRFDVIEIYAPDSYHGSYNIEHIENAF